jgi:hypothetical protein
MKGVVNPPVHFPKNGSQSKLPHDMSGDKVIEHKILVNGEAPDLGLSPPHRRLWDRDYSKEKAAPGDKDFSEAAEVGETGIHLDNPSRAGGKF